jgi:Tfp pilus assembly protein FimT
MAAAPFTAFKSPAIFGFSRTTARQEQQPGTTAPGTTARNNQEPGTTDNRCFLFFKQEGKRNQLRTLTEATFPQLTPKITKRKKKR